LECIYLIIAKEVLVPVKTGNTLRKQTNETIKQEGRDA